MSTPLDDLDTRRVLSNIALAVSSPERLNRNVHPLETYLTSLAEVRSSAAGTKETSYYPALHALFNEVGRDLKPKIHCILQLANRGAGNPDGGLYTPDQFQKLTDDKPITGQKPSRGAIEIKSPKDDAWLTSDGEQVTKYWKEYGQVLVTNYRDFVLVGRDSEGHAFKLASYRLAADEKSFWRLAAHPRKAAQEQGQRFLDFLKLVALSPAILASPKDVAWVLAYYAREAKARVESHPDPALGTLRTGLEQALGMEFKGEKGDHFFRSTLVQTVFYGVFSAWVLWSKRHAPTSREKFDWRLTQFLLEVPVIRLLFEQVVTKTHLRELGLVEVLDWTAAVLNRVDRASFFAQFQEQEAVQYFYEPFLEAFDPELRKELGVWYTPLEVVRYMVARTDEALRSELGIEDGLADPNVYVLDPCCGTGAFLVEALRAIAHTMEAKGKDPLNAHSVKRAAIERIFGFEILPAPLVISHLQLGLMLQILGAPFKDDGSERGGVFLTNSLTGWEPPKGPKAQLAFKEMEQEREAAERVKRNAPILVVIGNPPYNGFAAVGMTEEAELVRPYRTTKRASAPQGQGLNDLYVRFFRVAERRIVDGTGQGLVCFISNYSWLDGLSHTGMREHFLDQFDAITVDCLNGDKYKTGKVTPDGKPDPSVFSTESNPEGIQVGTAVSLLVRRAEHSSAKSVRYRDFWGKEKRQKLVESLAAPDSFPYTDLFPEPAVGLPFMPRAMEEQYLSWPTLPELLPTSYPGVKTSRDMFLVAMDRTSLEKRLAVYFDAEVSHEQMRSSSPEVMKTTPRFNAETTRDYLRHREEGKGRIVRYQYRPFDVRWLYWDPDTKLLDEKRYDYFQQVQPGNLWISAGQRNRMADFYQPQYMTVLADHHIVESNVAMFPLKLYPDAQGTMNQPAANRKRPNLSEQAQRYIRTLTDEPAELFLHILAALHAPLYCENAGALRQDWPRVPLPASRDTLATSAALGANLAALLNTEASVKGVTANSIRAELKPIGNLSMVQGNALDPSRDLKIEAGWGHLGKEGVTMPGKGKLTERDYTEAERAAIAEGAAAISMTLEQALSVLGEKTCDVYLNGRACWKNIPAKVWEYTIGGYQVIKKWLSYREAKLLGRAITPDEAHYVRDMARRIAAICLMQPQLDANYAATQADLFVWEGIKETAHADAQEPISKCAKGAEKGKE